MSALLLVAALAAPVTSCGLPTTHEPLQDPFFADDAPSPVSASSDEAEARWRSEIEHDRGTDPNPDALLTDDPPADPSHYGNVAFKDETPKTGWDKFKSNAETVGKASFAAASVAVTLGMMVAPYFLF